MWVALENDCGVGRDTTTIIVESYPTASNDAPDQLCYGDIVEVEIKPDPNNSEIEWLADGSFEHIKSFSKPGIRLPNHESNYRLHQQRNLGTDQRQLREFVLCSDRIYAKWRWFKRCV